MDGEGKNVKLEGPEKLESVVFSDTKVREYHLSGSLSVKRVRVGLETSEPRSKR